MVPQTRILVTITALYAVRKRTQALDVIRRALRSRTTTTRKLSELFIHLSLFLGYPAMLDGLEQLAGIAGRARGRSLVKSGQSSSHIRGRQILEQIYGRQAARLLKRLDALYPGLGHRITQDAYGLIMARDGLTMGQREVVNVVALLAHGFNIQLYSHLRGALRVGVSRTELASVVRLASRITGKSARKALRALTTIRSSP